MVTKTILTTSGKLKISVPTKPDEVTLYQIEQLSNEYLTDIQSLSILSGVNVDELYNVKNYDDINIFVSDLKRLVSRFSLFYNSDVRPKEINLNGKIIKIPKDLRVEPAGAYLVCEKLIADSINKASLDNEDWQRDFIPEYEVCYELLSQYLYCPYSGLGYNEGEANKLIPLVKELPAVVAFPIVKAFFLNFIK